MKIRLNRSRKIQLQTPSLCFDLTACRWNINPWVFATHSFCVHRGLFGGIGCSLMLKLFRLFEMFVIRFFIFEFYFVISYFCFLPGLWQGLQAATRQPEKPRFGITSTQPYSQRFPERPKATPSTSRSVVVPWAALVRGITRRPLFFRKFLNRCWDSLPIMYILFSHVFPLVIEQFFLPVWDSFSNSDMNIFLLVCMTSIKQGLATSEEQVLEIL